MEELPHSCGKTDNGTRREFRSPLKIRRFEDEELPQLPWKNADRKGETALLYQERIDRVIGAPENQAPHEQVAQTSAAKEAGGLSTTPLLFCIFSVVD